MNKSRLLKMTLALVLALSLMACSSSEDHMTENESSSDLPTDVVVFAAASMTESLEEVKDIFEAEFPDYSISYNFDSSGTLKTQIEQGAQVDVFLSAAARQMDELEEGGYIDEDSRTNLLENKVVLVVPESNPKDISDFKDLGEDRVEAIALGNEDVPVGQYSEEILTNLGIFDQIQPKVTYGSNVKEVTTWVGEGVVDCGIIYQTDAKAEGLEIVASAADDLIETPVVYPIGILDQAPNPQGAKDFLEFLTSDQAIEILEGHGFSYIR